jgi:hypothetical protein
MQVSLFLWLAEQLRFLPLQERIHRSPGLFSLFIATSRFSFTLSVTLLACRVGHTKVRVQEICVFGVKTCPGQLHVVDQFYIMSYKI